jgi:hypothetical protein
LWTLLGALLREYESRFGALNIDVTPADLQARNGGGTVA